MLRDKYLMVISSCLLAGLSFASMPQLEPAFSVAQIEKGAPKLIWTANENGWESTVLTERDAGMDLAGVRLSRKTVKEGELGIVVYRLENITKELRYAAFGWRTSFVVSGTNDRNWFPTAESVIDLGVQNTLWGYYAKPGNWQFSLVEPWFAAYNQQKRIGYAFLFDFNTLSAAYGSGDVKTRGVLFDGGMLPSGAKIEITTKIRALHGLPSLATVNDDFAAGFSGPSAMPKLEVVAFRNLVLTGKAGHRDVAGKVLGMADVNVTLTAGECCSACVIKSERPETQSILAAKLNGVRFECFRENGFRMSPVPMAPPAWPHCRIMPQKKLPEVAAVRQVAQDKALLVFGFYANFFRFQEMFPELTFSVIPAVPQGIANVPPASTICEYRYVFLGDVNEESVRPMMTRLAAYVKNGGTLVVGGGPFAYGCGGYGGSFLESMLPVKTHAFDCLPACAKDQNGRTPVTFDGGDAHVFWIQKDEVKPDSEVLMKTASGDPLLVRGTYGKGRVFAFLGAPLGDETTDAKAFWNNNAYYHKKMRELLK